MLEYICKKDRNDELNKNSYLNLSFDFSDKEVKKVANDVKQLCNYDMRAFSFLSNYLMKCCLNM